MKSFVPPESAAQPPRYIYVYFLKGYQDLAVAITLQGMFIGEMLERYNRLLDQTFIRLLSLI